MSLRTTSSLDPGLQEAWDIAHSGWFAVPNLDQEEAHLPVGVSLVLTLPPPAQVSPFCVSPLCILLCGFSSCVFICAFIPLPE